MQVARHTMPTWQNHTTPLPSLLMSCDDGHHWYCWMRGTTTHCEVHHCCHCCHLHHQPRCYCHQHRPSPSHWCHFPHWYFHHHHSCVPVEASTRPHLFHSKTPVQNQGSSNVVVLSISTTCALHQKEGAIVVGIMGTLLEGSYTAICRPRDQWQHGMQRCRHHS